MSSSAPAATGRTSPKSSSQHNDTTTPAEPLTPAYKCLLVLSHGMAPAVDSTLDVLTISTLFRSGHGYWALQVFIFTLMPAAAALAVGTVEALAALGAGQDRILIKVCRCAKLLLVALTRAAFCTPGVGYLSYFLFHYWRLTRSNRSADEQDLIINRLRRASRLELLLEALPQSMVQLQIIIHMGYFSRIQLMSSTFGFSILAAKTFAFAVMSPTARPPDVVALPGGTGVTTARCTQQAFFPLWILGGAAFLIGSAVALTTEFFAFEHLNLSKAVWLGAQFALAGMACIPGMISHLGKGFSSSVTRATAKGLLLLVTSASIIVFSLIIVQVGYPEPDGDPSVTYNDHDFATVSPVFFCFRDVNLTSDVSSTAATTFTLEEEALLVLCDGAPCPTRIRLCEEQENTLDLFRAWVLPVSLACMWSGLAVGFTDEALKWWVKKSEQADIQARAAAAEEV